MVKLLLELDELMSVILGKVAFPLRELNRAHFDLCFVGACGSIVPAGELGIKYRVVLSEKGVQVCSDSLRKDAVWVYLNGCRVTGIGGQ